MTRQCFTNAQFKVNVEEGLDSVEEFYTEKVVESEQIQPESKAKAKLNQGESFVQGI